MVFWKSRGLCFGITIHSELAVMLKHNLQEVTCMRGLV